MSIAEQRPAARRLPLPRPGTLAVGLCLLALAAAAWVATAIFDRVPHVEDDVAFLFQARTIASGRLFVPVPLKPEFFDIPFTLQRDGLWFGKYPPGYPAVLALGVLVGQPWLVEPILGAAAIGLTYLLGRRLYDPWVGLAGAALAAASPFFLLQAGSFMSHAACLFWATLFMRLFIWARDRRSAPLALATGLALGMLFISRQLTAVGVAVPFVLWGLGEVAFARRRFWLYVMMVVAFLPFALGLLVYNVATTGDPLRSAYELYWAYDKLGFGPDYGIRGHYLADAQINTRINLETLSTYLYGWPGERSLWPAALAVVVAAISLVAGLAGRAFGCTGGATDPTASQPVAPRGALTTTLSQGERVVVEQDAAQGDRGPQPSQGEGWGEGTSCLEPGRPTPTHAAPHPNPLPGGEKESVPLRQGVRSANLAGYDLLLAGVFASLVVLHAAYWAYGQMYGPRYYFEALTALTLLSARGLALLARALAAALRLFLAAGRARTVALAGIGALVVGLFAWSYTNFVPAEFGKTVRWYDIDDSGPRAVQVTGVHNAVVFVKRPYWTNYAPFFSHNSPLLDGDVVYAVDLGERNRELLALYPGRAAYMYANGHLEPLQ